MNDNEQNSEELEFTIDESYLVDGSTDEIEQVMRDYGVVSDNDIIQSIWSDYDNGFYEVLAYVEVR